MEAHTEIALTSLLEQIEAAWDHTYLVPGCSGANLCQPPPLSGRNLLFMCLDKWPERKPQCLKEVKQNSVNGFKQL